MICNNCNTRNPLGSRFCKACGTALADPEATVLRAVEAARPRTGRVATPVHGQILGPYRVGDLLGSGSMSSVYRASGLHKPDEEVALKILAPGLALQPDLIARFHREAESLRELDDPHVVEIFALFEAGGFQCLVMELLDGGSLRQVLQAAGPLPPVRAATYVRQAALGLQAVARAGIVHRDVKTDNLLMTDEDRVKLSDFGIAKAVSAETQLTGAGDAMGTPGYIPPEQWNDCRNVDTRSDLYSLGCVLFELLAGRLPFEGPTAAMFLQQHLITPAPDLCTLRPEVSAALGQVVARLMRKEPADRFQTPAELVEALDLCPELAPPPA